MANRYWVGGTGTWDSFTTTQWSATSGGAGGASVPTSADSVFFNSASSATAYTVTYSSGVTIGPVSFAQPASGNFTFLATSSSSNLSIGGNITIASGVVFGYDGTITIRGNGSTVATIIVSGGGALNNCSFVIDIGIYSVGGLKLLSNLNVKSLVLTKGTLNLNLYYLVTNTFNTNSTSTRDIDFGSGAYIQIQGTSGTVFNAYSVTNLTLTGTPNIFFLSGTAYSTRTIIAEGGNATSFNFSIAQGPLYSIVELPSTVRNLSFVGCSSTVYWYSNLSIFGNVTLGTTATFSSAFSWWFSSPTTTRTLTTSGKTISWPVWITATSASYTALQLADNFTSTSYIYLTSGGLDTNSKAVSVPIFQIAGPSIQLLALGTTTLSLSAAGATGGATGTASAWDNAGAGTLTITGTGTINLTSASAKIFKGGSFAGYPKLNQGGAGALTVTGSNGFTNITNTVQPASVLFTAGTTNTFTAFSLSGTAGNLITINSDTAADHYLALTTSSNPTVNYCNIDYSSVVLVGAGKKWVALNSVNGGHNTNWQFGVSRGSMMLLF